MGLSTAIGTRFVMPFGGSLLTVGSVGSVRGRVSISERGKQEGDRQDAA